MKKDIFYIIISVILLGIAFYISNIFNNESNNLNSFLYVFSIMLNLLYGSLQ